MGFGSRAVWEPVREINYDEFASAPGYTALGAPIMQPIRLITFSNETNVPIYVSFDGKLNHIRVVQFGFKLYDLCSNKVRDDGLFIEAKTQIYIKKAGSAPTRGDFWVEVMYADFQEPD